jgi:hypothetical protein
MTLEWILSLAVAGLGADPYDWSQPVLPAQYTPSAYGAQPASQYSTQPASQYAAQPSASQYAQPKAQYAQPAAQYAQPTAQYTQPTARAGISSAGTQAAAASQQYGAQPHASQQYVSPSAQARYGDLGGQPYAAQQPSLVQQYTTPQYQPVAAPQPQYAQPYSNQPYASQSAANQQPASQQFIGQSSGGQLYGNQPSTVQPTYGNQGYGNQPYGSQVGISQSQPTAQNPAAASGWQQSAGAYTADARAALGAANTALENVNRYTQPFFNDAWRQLPPPPTTAQTAGVQGQANNYGWPSLAGSSTQPVQPTQQPPQSAWPTQQGQQQFPVAANNQINQPAANYQLPQQSGGYGQPAATPQPPPLLPPQGNWPSQQQPLDGWADPRLASNATREPQPTLADPRTAPATDRWGNPIAATDWQTPAGQGNFDPRTAVAGQNPNQPVDPRLYPAGTNLTTGTQPAGNNPALNRPAGGNLPIGQTQPVLQPPAQANQPAQFATGSQNAAPTLGGVGGQAAGGQNGQLANNQPPGTSPLGNSQPQTGQIGAPQFGGQSINPYDRLQPPALDGANGQPTLASDPRWNLNNATANNGAKASTAPSLRDEVPDLFTMVKTPNADRQLAAVGTPTSLFGSNGDGTPADRPWFPLMLSLLGLFASLGVNLYLGWIAFESHFRYRRLLIEGDDDDALRSRAEDREARR